MSTSLCGQLQPGNYSTNVLAWHTCKRPHGHDGLHRAEMPRLYAGAHRMFINEWS